MFKFETVVTLMLFSLLTSLQYGAASAQTNVSLTYRIDTSNVPDLTFRELSFFLPVGQIESASVFGDSVSMDSEIDLATGTLRFTTAATQVTISLIGVQDTNDVGSLQKAALKHHKNWAWSIGFDDNTGIKASIAALDTFGYRGTLFMIANIIDETRVENWIIDKPDLLNYLANGWSIGNHTWDHECDGANDLTSTIMQGYERLAGIAAVSSRPNYKVTSFAAPCFTAEYHPYILDMRNNGETAVQFNESGGDYRIAVDRIGEDDFFLDDRFVQVFDFDRRVGRQTEIGWDAAATINEIDWLALQASPDLHLWFNCLAHGGSEAIVQEVAQHIHDNYGAGGTDEVWVAPSDEIYSYLLVRERVVVSQVESIAPLSASIVQGDLAAGSFVDLEASDNVDLSVRRAAAQVASVVEVELQSQTSVVNPSLLDFTVEGSSFYRTQIVQSIYLYDFAASQFVQVDSRIAPRFADAVTTASGSGDLSRFVEDGSGLVRTRIRFASAVNRQRFTTSLDQAFWTIN